MKRDQKRQNLLQSAENSLEVIFMTKYQNKNFFKKKTHFDQSRAKTPQIKQNLLRNDYYGQTTQNLKVGQKRQQLLKVNFSRSKKGKHCHES